MPHKIASNSVGSHSLPLPMASKRQQQDRFAYSHDTHDNNISSLTSRVRERQWMYLGPILAAPIAHISVSMYREAKTPRHAQLLLGVGVVGATAATLSMRLYLMWHAGYAGNSGESVRDRERIVSQQEKHEMENPSKTEIVKQAFRGFG